jgi:hypothetical protein
MLAIDVEPWTEGVEFWDAFDASSSEETSAPGSPKQLTVDLRERRA